MSRLHAPLVALVLAACGGASPAKPGPDKAPAATPSGKTDVQQPDKADPPRQPTTAAACPADGYPAAAPLAAMLAATDVAGVRAAYDGTPLQALIKSADAATGRTDDAAIAAALAEPEAIARVAAVTAIQSAMSQWMRHNLEVAARDPDPARRPPAFAAARCAWEHGLRGLGLELARRTAEGASEANRDDAGVVETIDARFAGDPADERQVMPAREAIEKTWFRVVHRELAAAATAAQRDKDPVAARRALGLFRMISDRLKDRNTPAIAVIEAQLAGEPGAIDPPAILKQIDIALSKRARKYCGEAVDPKLHGTAAGATSVTEGEHYTRILLPAMRAALGAQSFDAAGYMTTWQAFAEAVEASDKDEVKKHSDELVHWNCAFQQTLGIRECTASADEVAPRALTSTETTVKQFFT